MPKNRPVSSSAGSAFASGSQRCRPAEKTRSHSPNGRARSSRATRNLPARDALRPFPTLLVNAGAKVIERYTRVADKVLLYQYTVVDPAIYTGPWLAEYAMARSDRPLYEFACHEGNYSLPNILAGARLKDRERAAAR